MQTGKPIYFTHRKPFIVDKFSYEPKLGKTQESSFWSRHDLQYNEDSKDKYSNLWKTQASNHEISIL